jgi:hypothetical protein
MKRLLNRFADWVFKMTFEEVEPKHKGHDGWPDGS